MNYLNKLRKCISIIRHKSDYVDKASYYPEKEQKSKQEILKDHLWFVWNYGELEPFYFTYGFDRKEMTRQRMTDEYIIPYHKFERRINYLNLHNPRYNDFQGRMTGRVITAEKFYFNIFLERFNIPTPKVLCFIKDKKPLYFNSQYIVDTALTAKEQLKLFFSNDMDAFCKPTAGQLGNGAFALRIGGGIYIDDEMSDFDRLLNILLSDDYLIQERIYQHDKMAELNPSSINTIRLQTVMDKDGVVHPFGAGLRIGRKGSSVDNWAKGGIFVGIDMDKGTLMGRGFIKPEFGTSAKEHPDTHIKFKGFEIPYYKEAEDLAVKLHSYLYRCHSVGWDIAITPDGPCFIEGNGLWEISLSQAVHGGMKKEIGKYFC